MSEVEIVVGVRSIESLQYSIQTFEIRVIWHRPECLRTPRVQPSHFHNWADGTMGTVGDERFIPYMAIWVT